MGITPVRFSIFLGNFLSLGCIASASPALFPLFYYTTPKILSNSAQIREDFN